MMRAYKQGILFKTSTILLVLIIGLVASCHPTYEGFTNLIVSTDDFHNLVLEVVYSGTVNISTNNSQRVNDLIFKKIGNFVSIRIRNSVINLTLDELHLGIEDGSLASQIIDQVNQNTEENEVFLHSVEISIWEES